MSFFNQLFDRFHAFTGDRIRISRVLDQVKCDDEEPELVDPQTVLRAKCNAEHCMDYQAKLDSCNTRVRSRKQTAETCYEELIDLFHCVDHCVAKDLLKKLK